MQLFYLPNIQAGAQALPDEEARHAIQVLRKRAGDVLDIVDGCGGWYRGTISAVDKRACWIDVLPVRQEPRRAEHRLVMAVSPTKMNERFEWFLEKATEIGVDEIYPLACTRTERPKIREDRYTKVLVSAMKQSLQAWLPVLHPLTPLPQVLAQVAATHRCLMGWCDDAGAPALGHNYTPGQDVCVFIGPEGDFTAAEVALARQAGALPVMMGPTRLRTETAALVATQTIALLNQLNA